MIDLASLADAYRERLRRERQAMAPLVLALVAAVDRLDRESRALDARTARWPILAHRVDALAVSVDVPRDATHPAPGLGAALAAGAERTVAGFALVTSAWEQATALRRLTSTVAAAAVAASRSVERNKATPRGDDFYPGRPGVPGERDAGDLVGQLVTVLRVALADQATLAWAGLSAWVALRTLEEGLAAPGGAAAAPGGAAAGPAGAKAAGTAGSAEPIVAAVEVQMALMVALPAIGTFVAAVGAGIDHEARARILAGAQATERRLLDGREAALRGLMPASALSEFLHALDHVVRYDIVAVCGWVAPAAEVVIDWLRLTLTLATRAGQDAAGWLNLLMNAADRLPWGAGGPLPVSLPGPSFDAVTLPPFPELDPEVRDGRLTERLAGELRGLRERATAAIGAAADGVTAGLRTAGAEVEGLGPTLSRTARTSVLVGQVDRATATVFGADRSALVPEPTGRPFARTAEALEAQVLTAGGFEVVASLVPHFLAEAGRTWRDLGAVPHPTSPHVLARHGRLAGVRVPEVTVRVGRGPDDEVAAAVATELRRAIEQAYERGRRRFDALAAPGVHGEGR